MIPNADSMKNLSYILVAALLVLSTFSLVTYTSCNTDKCKDISCKNGGACNGGTCACTGGYKGAFCQIPPDFCDLNTCLNGGTCANSTCNCPAGYDGTLCENEARTKFLGGWLATDHVTGTTINVNYSSLITAGTALTEVKIMNINGQFSNPINATVNGGTINIALQSPDNPGKTVQGVGTYDATTNSINWIYAITYPPNPSVVHEAAWQGN